MADSITVDVLITKALSPVVRSECVCTVWPHIEPHQVPDLIDGAWCGNALKYKTCLYLHGVCGGAYI